MPSPDSDVEMEEGLISVDKWTTVSQVYFLTHLHSDHTEGLTPKWSKGPLYCSPITARLFPVRFPGFDMLLVRVLEAGKPQTLTLVSRSSHSKVLVEVTAIDARHCPGTLMYLFRGQFGSVLYTGDFRWEIGDMKAVEGKNILLNALGDEKLDLLYIDNTYCNPSFSFPPRNSRFLVIKFFPFSSRKKKFQYSLEKLLLHVHVKTSLPTYIPHAYKVFVVPRWTHGALVKSWSTLSNGSVGGLVSGDQQVVDIMTSFPHHDFVIGVDNLGKEDLLLHISQMLKTKIWVWPERLRVMHLLGFKDAFTTKTCLTRVRAVTRYSLTFETIESLNTVRPTIGILPTGLPWGKKFLNQKSLSYSCISLCKEDSDIFAETGHTSEMFKSPRKLHQHMFAVSYSEHSCFKEIEEFIKFVNPSRISGIVSSAFCCINPRHYLDHPYKDESDHLCCKDSRGKLGLSVAWKTESVLESDKAFGIDKQINISVLLKGCKLRATHQKYWVSIGAW